jgi:hypothetical protein
VQSGNRRRRMRRSAKSLGARGRPRESNPPSRVQGEVSASSPRTVVRRGTFEAAWGSRPSCSTAELRRLRRREDSNLRPRHYRCNRPHHHRRTRARYACARRRWGTSDTGFQPSEAQGFSARTRVAPAFAGPAPRYARDGGGVRTRYTRCEVTVSSPPTTFAAVARPPNGIRGNS